MDPERYANFRDTCIHFTTYHKYLKEEIIELFGENALESIRKIPGRHHVARWLLMGVETAGGLTRDHLKRFYTDVHIEKMFSNKQYSEILVKSLETPFDVPLNVGQRSQPDFNPECVDIQALNSIQYCLNRINGNIFQDKSRKKQKKSHDADEISRADKVADDISCARDDVHENDYVDYVDNDDDDDDDEAEDDGNGDNDDDDGNDDKKAEDDGNDDNEAEVCVCESLSLMGLRPSSIVPGNTHVAATSNKNLAATRSITTRSSSGGGPPTKVIYTEAGSSRTSSRHKKRKTVPPQEDVEVQVPNNSLSTSFVFFIFFVFFFHHSNFILGRGK